MITSLRISCRRTYTLTLLKILNVRCLCPLSLATSALQLQPSSSKHTVSSASFALSKDSTSSWSRRGRKSQRLVSTASTRSKIRKWCRSFISIPPKITKLKQSTCSSFSKSTSKPASTSLTLTIWRTVCKKTWCEKSGTRWGKTSLSSRR